MHKDILLGYLKPILLLIVVGAAIYFLLLRRPSRTIVIDSPGVGSSPPGSSTSQESLEMVTLLPKDAIPSIDFPEFYAVPKADMEYEPEEFVISVVIDETYQDDRLYAKEFVIGVENEEYAAAYPFSELNRQPVINDELGDLPILVAFNPDSAAAAVFSRIGKDGTVLTFSTSDSSLLVDDQTGTTWDRFTGLALEGPLAGSQLQPVKYTAAFWFGWKDWYPGTTVYGE